MSGDNDVGGETYRDKREAWKVERFQSRFHRSDVTTAKHIDFINVRAYVKTQYNAKDLICYCYVLARSRLGDKL